MNLENLFITDNTEFESRRLEVEKLFHCNATLPDQVFREGFNYFAFENWERMFGGEFWPVIQELAETSADESVLLGVFDADPSSFWRKHFGHYGWAKIPVSLSSCEFSDLLNEDPTQESPPGGVNLYAHKMVLVPQSAKWAIWGERRWEIWVVGFREELPTSSLNGVRWAVDINLTYCFEDSTVPPDFMKKFRSNYGSSDLDDCPLHLVIGAVKLVPGKVVSFAGAKASVSRELQPEFERTRFLHHAPFKVIRLTIRFGTRWGEPEFIGINERYAELEVGIEMPLSEVRNLDDRPLLPAVLCPTTPLQDVVKKATFRVLVAVAQKYGLDGRAWQEKLSSLTLRPQSRSRLKERR